jgi:hypothetical protein
MRARPALLAALVLPLGLAACNSQTAGTGAPYLAAGSPTPLPAPGKGAKWEMPWQLAVASPASEAQGERTYVSFVEGYGNVRGTTPALTYLNYPLSTIAKPRGANRAVAPCRRVVEQEAKAKGAVKVEAAAAGPGRRVPDGYEGPVAFRIMYRKADGYEVRQSFLACKLDRGGVVRDAKVTSVPGSQIASARPPAAFAALPAQQAR